MTLSTMGTPTGNRRRSQRVLLVTPVILSWITAQGVSVQERGETEIISAHGTLIRTKVQFRPGTEIRVRNAQTHLSARARVVGAGPASSDGLARIALELSVPSWEFWGISFPPASGNESDLQTLLALQR